MLLRVNTAEGTSCFGLRRSVGRGRGRSSVRISRILDEQPMQTEDQVMMRSRSAPGCPADSAWTRCLGPTRAACALHLHHVGGTSHAGGFILLQPSLYSVFEGKHRCR